MPPIRHLVFMQLSSTFREPEQYTHILHGFSTLQSVIPRILYYTLFPLTRNPYPGYTQGNPGYDLCLDCIFADSQAQSAYAHHPAFIAIISQVMGPLLDHYLAIDYSLGEQFDLVEWKAMQRRPHIRHLLCYRVREGQEGEVEAINAELQATRGTVPSLLSVHTGQQRMADMYPGFVDRSMGLDNVVDLVLQDAAALQEWEQHPAHDLFLKQRMPSIHTLWTFTYSPE